MTEYSLNAIAHSLSLTPKTVSSHAKFLGIKPSSGSHGTHLFQETDVARISELASHLKDSKNSKSNFIPSAEIEIVKEPSVRKITRSPHKIIKETIEFGLANDPLYDLEILQRICDRGWILPTKRMATILQIRPRTLAREKQYFYCGFLTEKVGYRNGSGWWKVIELQRES